MSKTKLKVNESDAKSLINNQIKAKGLFGEIDTTIAYWRTRPVELQVGLLFSMYQTLRTIDFYYNSKYLTGNLDQLGREKPFRNISKFRVHVAMRCTEIDIKNCEITADESAWNERSFILNHELYEWMKVNHFDETLNDIGRTRAKYGGVLVKRSWDTNGNLVLSIPEWKNMVTDQIDIKNGIKIERFWMNPKDVADKKDVWDNVEQAIKQASKTRQNVTNTGLNTVGNSKQVQIYDVEGYFNNAMNPDEEVAKDNNELEYHLMHFIMSCNSNDYILLFSEELDESNFKYKEYDRVEGRSLGVGVVEDGFDAQVWTNDAVVGQKNAMDLAGKIILKTNSKKVGSNVLSDVDNGRIFELEDGKIIEPIQLFTNAIPQFENLIADWDRQYERVSSTYGALIGEGSKGFGSNFRQIAFLANQANELFIYRKMEAGNFIAEVLNDWVLPELIKKINMKHILADDFSGDELKKIDESFAKYLAMQELIQNLIGGKTMHKEAFMGKIQEHKNKLMSTGSKRYLEIPKDYFKGFKGKTSINITKELDDKEATIAGLNQILGIVAQNPAVLQDPTLKTIFDKILELDGGISPISLPDAQPQQVQGQQPQNGQQMQAQPSPVNAQPQTEMAQK